MSPGCVEGYAIGAHAIVSSVAMPAGDLGVAN